MSRPGNNGRDFFDVVFLLGLNDDPDRTYLQDRIGASSKAELAELRLDQCAKLDMKEPTEDVRPLLFKAELAERVPRRTSSGSSGFNEAALLGPTPFGEW